VKFAWIQTEKADYPLTKLCCWLGVTRSGFYVWQQRPVSPRAEEDRRLKVLVHTSFTAGRGYYGSPRVHDDLLEWEEHVSRKRVIRLMQEEGLQARVRKRYKSTTMSDHDQPVADNLLQQVFNAERLNHRWVGDTSELRIGENGKAYLAVVLDLFSRFVVGWAISAVNDRHLTIKALDMALKRRCPLVGLLHHSDQGSTLGFKGSSQRVFASLSVRDFEVPLQGSSSRKRTQEGRTLPEIRRCLTLHRPGDLPATARRLSRRTRRLLT
jgi:putative transposase